MKKTSFLFALLLTSALSQPALADQQDNTAAATIEAFHEALLQGMQQDDDDGRLATMSSAVVEHFAVSTICRISLGSRTWRDLDLPAQSAFEALMRRLISSTYASRFDNYKQQTFEILNAKAISEDRHRVRSQLVTTTEMVSLDYQLQRTDGQWRIYDVAANGVSDLSLKRSNYAALFKQGGLTAVEDDIRHEIAKHEPAQVQ